MKNKFKRGFTLIELLMVVSIIGLLSSITLASLVAAKQKARGAAIVSDIRQLKYALELYKTDHGEYPGAGTEWANWGASYSEVISMLETELVQNNYIPSIPQHADADGEYYYVIGADEIGYSCGGEILNEYIFIFRLQGLELNLSKLDGEEAYNYYCIGS